MWLATGHVAGYWPCGWLLWVASDRVVDQRSSGLLLCPVVIALVGQRLSYYNAAQWRCGCLQVVRVGGPFVCTAKAAGGDSATRAGRTQDPLTSHNASGPRSSVHYDYTVSYCENKPIILVRSDVLLLCYICIIMCLHF